MKFRAGDHASPEQRNVLGLVLEAKERGYDAVVFLRDTDGDRDRAQQIGAALHLIPAKIADPPKVVGGLPTPSLEAWIVALKGVVGSESMSQTKLIAQLEALGVRPKHVESYVAVIEATDMARCAQDATSLRSFVSRSLTSSDAPRRESKGG